MISVDFKPAYLAAAADGRLAARVEQARRRLKNCVLCPRRCRVDRTDARGEKGVCSTGEKAVVAAYEPHFGEEAPLVGTGGSGTIFFANCSLGCNFCQNYDISHAGVGREVADEELAAVMLRLQRSGCHNINFVTPSHVVPPILAALDIAARQELNIPLVYNSSGYDSVETLALLDGIIDIYMPDFKFWDAEPAALTCGAPDYPAVARNAVKEMHRQVGDLFIDEEGIARRGLLVRHLVMPGDLAGTRGVMRFIARHISPRTYVNIMPQYRPCGKAHEMAVLAHGLEPDAFEKALEAAAEEGIRRLDQPRRRFVLC